MYLGFDKRTPWRYTRGFFLFLDGLKSRLTQGYLFKPNAVWHYLPPFLPSFYDMGRNPRYTVEIEGRL
jgi:hypothetical protein